MSSGTSEPPKPLRTRSSTASIAAKAKEADPKASNPPTAVAGPAAVTDDKILCCKFIQVTSTKVPDSKQIAFHENQLYFLCSFWANKCANADNAPSANISSADFIGAIELKQMDGEKVVKGGTRWYAVYRPGHKNSSKKGGGHGPDGQFMEISIKKAARQLKLGHMIATDAHADYGDCHFHPEQKYIAKWYHMMTDKELRDGSKFPKVTTGSEQVDVCRKCKKKCPAQETEVNIFTGNLTCNRCFKCQRYDYYTLPRSAAGKTVSKENAEAKGSNVNKKQMAKPIQQEESDSEEAPDLEKEALEEMDRGIKLMRKGKAYFKEGAEIMDQAMEKDLKAKQDMRKKLSKK
ncbi:hypothetical protein M430DRAFT_17380 [Amorphotheca resinae ATCC 22711]|jgi:hypothetical protein|uniref:Uncharacterized protein n=1 Tax=Amorphotheca resinae ATCC 22711 TaxID=857342 RepID=A0A2T3B994_AMORE|nr:hypothetical protein M430DRAFT_17380 [Amorphotheca resinae ATCC 22711]PSS23458.1 hypothetical protein M430DRAFT_17380 [Amorphotheca resinae ATCC 22711]